MRVRDLVDRAIPILEELVGFPTVTTESNLELIEHAAAVLEPLGADLELTFDESGLKANLLATIGPRVDGGVIFSGHTDVVPAEREEWTGDPFVAMRRRERIYGRGTADIKGFIACALALAPHFAQMPLSQPIHIALTFDEEIGCRGAPLLIAGLERSGLRPGAAIVGEPTGMGIVTAHKGMYEYTTRIVGMEGHASRPQQAVNAVEYGNRYVGKLMELGAELARHAPGNSPYDPPHTTISVGLMQGGTARNVVAGDCIIEWEMRPVARSDADLVRHEISRFETRLTEEMHAVSADASVVTTTEGEVDGLEAANDSPALRILSRALGGGLPQVAAFGTEAGLYQRAGIPAVVCGPGTIDVAHQPDEYVSMEQLEACLAMMLGVAEQLT